MATDLRVPLSDAEKSCAPRTVCVTGATGYLAGLVVQRLLASGHTVHGTCRSPDNEALVAGLKALPGAGERLKLFKADLLTAGSFDAAVRGCQCVMHTASPYVVERTQGREREMLIEPAVRGTENVLESVTRCESVTHVVLTSSCAAIYGEADEKGEGHIFSEEDWDEAATETHLPYSYSKRVAEEKAWEMCKKQSRWTMCAMNPSQIFGPPTSSRTDGVSVSMVKTLMTGGMWPAAPAIGLGVVDVRDVAAAHCRAMAKDDASGRYILCSRSLHLLEIAALLREKFPKACWLPRYKAPKALVVALAPLLGMGRDIARSQINKTPLFDNSKAKRELGMEFIDPSETLEDQVNGMVKLGIMQKKF
eukprot:evm.model.scf_274.2 EVM.evm.TU.scf_274.2   scf_274:13939-18385(+)